MSEVHRVNHMGWYLKNVWFHFIKNSVVNLENILFLFSFIQFFMFPICCPNPWNTYQSRIGTFCYEQLCNIQGSLVTFGFNFGEYDTHIIDAINTAAKMGRKVPGKLWSVYIGVYSDENLDHILKIKDKFRCKVTPYDARTAKIWDT